MGIACKYKKNEEGGEEGKNCYLNFKTKEIFYIGACPWFNFCENLCLQFWVFLLCLSGTVISGRLPTGNLLILH